MEDVTGFNQKSPEYDGEKLVEIGIKKLKQRFSEHICEIIKLMLRFNESERPSFIELAKLVLTSTDNTLDASGQPVKSIDPQAVASMVSSKQNLAKLSSSNINLNQT